MDGQFNKATNILGHIVCYLWFVLYKFFWQQGFATHLGVVNSYISLSANIALKLHSQDNQWAKATKKHT
jgi:hypothetical protein